MLICNYVSLYLMVINIGTCDRTLIVNTTSNQHIKYTFILMKRRHFYETWYSTIGLWQKSRMTCENFLNIFRKKQKGVTDGVFTIKLLFKNVELISPSSIIYESVNISIRKFELNSSQVSVQSRLLT